MSKLYSAKAGVVVAYDYVEFEIDLGFGVKLMHSLKINLGLPKLVEKSVTDKAKRCMVVLLGGGKKVTLEVDERETFTYVYCVRKANPDYTFEIGMGTVVDVAKIMQEMYKKDFDSDYMVANMLRVKNTSTG